MSDSRLVVFSSVSHYNNHDVTAHAGFVREIDIWAKIFERVLIITIHDSNQPSEDAIPYKETNVEFFWLDEQIKTSGIIGKVRLALYYPKWIMRSMRVLLPNDIIMARGPDSIGFLGVIVSKLKGLQHFAKYADQWENFKDEPIGYRLQKMVYRSRYFGGPVQIYGAQDRVRTHLVPFFTSSISYSDWIEAGELIKEREFSIPLRVLFVGRLVKAKGVDVSIRAIGLLRQNGYKINLDIVGDGPEAKNLSNLAQDLGLSNIIHFSGNQGWESLKQKYASSHCFIQPSRKEGFGKVLLEAMTFALPIVATDVGVSRELLKTPQYGMIVSPDNSQAIADVVSDIYNNYARYNSLGINARDHAKRFLLDNVEELYRSFVDLYLNKID